MSNASAPSSVESAPVLADNGTSVPAATVPMTIPDDMLYEVVDGKLVEKIVGASEIEIAAMLVGFLGHVRSDAPARTGPRRVDFPH